MRNPLSMLQAGSAFVRLTADMSRLDEVFNLSDGLVNDEASREMVEACRAHETGARALETRPHVHLDLKVLRALPTGTLGREYALMMDRNGLDPASIPSLPDDDEGKYVRAHLYETHDLWHVVTGFGTDVPGELGLQAFYQAQLPGKLPAAARDRPRPRRGRAARAPRRAAARGSRPSVRRTAAASAARAASRARSRACAPRAGRTRTPAC